MKNVLIYQFKPTHNMIRPKNKNKIRKNMKDQYDFLV